MFCHKCGAKLLENAKFCRQCGEKIIDISDDDLPVKNSTVSIACKDQPCNEIADNTNTIKNNNIPKANSLKPTSIKKKIIPIIISIVLMIPVFMIKGRIHSQKIATNPSQVQNFQEVTPKNNTTISDKNTSSINESFSQYYMQLISSTLTLSSPETLTDKPPINYGELDSYIQSKVYKEGIGDYIIISIAGASFDAEKLTKATGNKFIPNIDGAVRNYLDNIKNQETTRNYNELSIKSKKFTLGSYSNENKKCYILQDKFDIAEYTKLKGYHEENLQLHGFVICKDNDLWFIITTFSPHIPEAVKKSAAILESVSIQ